VLQCIDNLYGLSVNSLSKDGSLMVWCVAVCRCVEVCCTVLHCVVLPKTGGIYIPTP